MQISWLPEPEKHPLWPAILSLLQPAADYGDAPVRCDDELVWIIYDGPVLYAAATTLLWDDGEAELRLAGGHRHKEWAGLLSETVSAWAKSAGAKKLTGRGRRGWSRYARELGWSRLGEDEDGRLIFEKEL